MEGGGMYYEFGKRGWWWLKLSLKNGETVLKVGGRKRDIESRSIYLILVKISRQVLLLTCVGNMTLNWNRTKKELWGGSCICFQQVIGEAKDLASATPLPLLQEFPSSCISTTQCIHCKGDFRARFQTDICEDCFSFFLKKIFFNLFITYCIDCCSANCSLGIVTFYLLRRGLVFL